MTMLETPGYRGGLDSEAGGRNLLDPKGPKERDLSLWWWQVLATLALAS